MSGCLQNVSHNSLLSRHRDRIKSLFGEVLEGLQVIDLLHRLLLDQVVLGLLVLLLDLEQLLFLLFALFRQWLRQMTH